MQINQTTDRTRLLQKLIALTAANRDNVVVTETELTDKVIFNVRCDDRDYGRIVGSKGANIMAWSVVAAAVCQNNLAKDAEIIVAEPKSRKVHPLDKYQSNPNWGVKDVSPLLKELALTVFNRGGVEVAEADSLIVANITVREENLPFDTVSLASAISRVFRCVGAANGRRLEVEVTYAPLPDTSGR